MQVLSEYDTREHARHVGRMAATPAEIIADLRRQSGWTQTELARRSGVSQSMISKVEHGERECSIEVYAALCGAFGLAVDVTPIPPGSAARAELNAALLGLSDEDLRQLARLARVLDEVPSAMLEGLLLMAEERRKRHAV